MVPLTSEHIVAAAGTESSQSVAKDKATDEEVGSVNKLSGMTALVKGLTNGLGWVSGRGTITLVGDRLVGLVV